MRIKDKSDDETSKFGNLSRLKDRIIESREMLIDAERDARRSGISLNGLSDVISKLSEFVVRIDLRQFRNNKNDNN